jgi:hypothetical protein
MPADELMRADSADGAYDADRATGGSTSDRPNLASQADSVDTLGLLRCGQVEVLGRMPWSSNTTLLVEVHRGADCLQAVYKPRRGERPLWDFPDGLDHREVAAYELSAWLGWDIVPETVLRADEGLPFGVGSLQRFVAFDPEQHYFTLAESRPNDFRPVALFDAVANNADRKAGHCLLSSDGALFFVDHGVCFHRSPKLRTVIWEFAGQPLDPGLTDALSRLCTDLDASALAGELASLLSAAEITALRRRVERLLSTRTYPVPGSERPYPWPVV